MMSCDIYNHGINFNVYPYCLYSVYRSVVYCENLCGLDRNLMARILKGKWSQCTTGDHTGRTSKKIMIEYDIVEKKNE